MVFLAPSLLINSHKMKHLLPTNPALTAILATLFLWIGLSFSALAQTTNADDSLTNAQVAITKRDWASAERILLPLSKSQPDNPFVFYEMAQVYENTNRTDAAKQIYQGIASMPDAAQRQYTVVVRAANASYMTSLVALAQSKLNAINASAPARPATVAAKVAEPVMTAKSMPTSTPAPSTPVSVANDVSTEVTAAMQNWAKAWANKDLSAYFASYTPHFSGDKASVVAWKKARATNINSKKAITLDLANISITPTAPSKVQMSFKQHYTSDTFKEVSQKTLEWIKQGNMWLINRETSQ
jgi:hypothetical protein